jgi:hypothetical protein
LKEGALPQTTVTYNKTVVMKGMCWMWSLWMYETLTKNRTE